jgi:histidinol-phosphate/aromatic aminotransferase/cobyric acid decarboxylase-like protein
MTRKTSLANLIEKHKALDGAIKDDREGFLSDWNGDHPFVERYLGPELLEFKLTKPLPSRYIYFDDEHSVLEAVSALHGKLEGLKVSRQNVAAGPGSSSLLVAFSLWLLQQRYEEVYYVPPLYHTLHYFLRLLGLRLRPVSGKHAFEPGAVLNLPPKRTMLLLCDPVWYAGRSVPAEKMAAIAEWQRRTNSLIFIDGSFQYMQWNGDRREQTAALDPEATFRLICPTKSLAIPFFRFAYLLHPARFHDEFLFLYESIVGGANISDLAFARRSLEVLSAEEGNRALTDFLRETYERLSRERLIQTEIPPECGYFVFAAPEAELLGGVTMDQDYFEQRNYPGYVRINLMVAHNLLSGAAQKETHPVTGG